MAIERFEEAAKKALAGERVKITPRELVGWWGASRRGRNIVAAIRRQLKRKKLTTVPDFEVSYIDSHIRLVRKKTVEGAKGESKTATAPTDTAESGQVPIAQAAEPAHRISRLEAAGRKPLSVNPSDSAKLAVTMMLQNDYSQLPVMQTPSKVVGMVSWRSIGKKLHVAGPCKTVEECMERAYDVSDTASLFEVSQLVAAHDAVVVRAANSMICGIVTNADISLQFGTLAEPFLLLGDIENALRCLIERSFKANELKAAVDPTDENRRVESVNDLTFGEYLRLVEKPENWDRLGLALDRAEVVKNLERIREIRNDVMHFDPDPLDEASIHLLRSFSKFLGGLLALLQ